MRQVKKIALMAVGDDAWQGGIQYIINIINALNALKIDPVIEVHLFRHSKQRFSGLDHFKNVQVEVFDINETLPGWSIQNRVKWLAQRKFFKRINPRIENFMLSGQYDYVFPATLSDCGGKLNAGAWIADFQYRYFPDGANKSISEHADRVISAIAQNTPKIILSSKWCESDCVRFFPSSEGKTNVMPFAVFIDRKNLEFTDFESIRRTYDIPQDFILVSNLFAPTKNHETLFRALGILKQQGQRVNLVCTGNIHDYAKPEYANEVLQMLTKYKVRDLVHIVGLIPRADQISLFRMAQALVQPSLSEGWSTFVEEAKVLGKPLVLSDIELHKEQYPGNPYFFSSMDAENLAEVIKRSLADNAHRKYPDLADEQRAYDDYQLRVVEFGNRFMEIAMK
jgi:glycosyltransferase involved in cell wall biosynthesis